MYTSNSASFEALLSRMSEVYSGKTLSCFLQFSVTKIKFVSQGVLRQLADDGVVSEVDRLLEVRHVLCNEDGLFCEIVGEFMEDFEVGEQHGGTLDLQVHLLPVRKGDADLFVYLAAAFLR